MRALRCAGEGRVEMVEAPMPQPGDGEALVRVECSALCGSERGAVDAGMNGNAGHEACGIVVSVPPGAHVQAGERVGISAIRGCGICEQCLAGIETRCTRGPQVQIGLHAEYVAVATQTLRVLPPDTDAVTGTLLTGDALGVPARALRRAPSQPGERVVVLGLGPVGLAHVMVRAAQGCEVIGIEPSAARRNMALQLGACMALSPDDDAPPARLVIEATGNAAVIDRAFDLAEPGGTVLQSGECGSATIRPSHSVVHREVSYLGAWYYASEDYPAMLDMQRNGLDVRRLVSHQFSSDEAQTAFRRFLGGDTAKAVLHWETTA
jgi:L-iditol 2-dehydrogenase